MRSRLVRTLLVCAAIGGLLIHRADTVRAVSNGIVISQVYGGGGNANATYKNDFVELFNRGGSPVTFSNWTVQYSTNANTSAWTVIATISGTLQPGQYFLVAQAGGATGTSLPTADASGSTNMSQTNAKVALVSSTTPISGACPGSASIIDLVGYGTNSAACFEGGGPAPQPSSSLSDQRAGGGCTDTDSNSADFATGTPTARNTATTLAPCGGGDTAPSVSSTTPANSATNVPVNSTIVINFSESVTASASAFSLECPAASPQTFTQTASPATTFTLTPGSPLPAGATCQVTVNANNITDTDGTPDHMTANYSFTFTTVSLTDTAPSVSSVTPGNGALNVPVASTIAVTFSESVTLGAAPVSLLCANAVQTIGVTGGPTTFTLTPSAPLPYGANCTLTVFGGQVTDTDGIAPANMIGDATSSFTTAAAPPPGAGIVMINEVDADTPGSDTAEFIELYDGGLGNTPLDGLVVVLYDGGLSPFTGNQAYAAFELTNKSTDASGYFVLGNPGVPNAGLTFDPGQFGLLQNGPDAVALYIGHASDFPNGTVVTTNNVLDAVVYGTDDPVPANLMSLINSGQKIVNENATGNGQTQSSQRCPAGMGGFRNTSPYYPGAPTPGTANNCPAARPPSDVVISQIYGGGGNGGATYRNDFVEVYNRGASPVDLTGWSFQYSPAASNGSSFLVQPIGGSIGAGQYYLIQLASGGNVGSPLPVDANIVGNINISSTSGKVSLVNSFDALLGGCPIYDPHIMDFVGYGTADCSEGLKTAPTLSNTTADFRKAGGGQDTDVNGDDFDTPTVAPFPRRTEPIVELGPFVFRTDPGRTGLDAPRDATIDVTFTEAVTVDPAWFNLTCASSGQHHSATFASSFGGQDQYITPNDNFIAGEQCTVTILKDRVHDVDLNDNGPDTDTLKADYSWSFTVATGTAPPYPASVHLTMGNPGNAGSDPSNYLMEKPEFALSYNRDLGRPNWVSWHLSDEWVGTLARVDTFRPDPQVPPEWYRVQSFDFSGSGFDRGHMTPNADRDKETSIPINQATFLMSNMIAQAPANNQGPWAALEAYLRTLTDPANQTEPGNNELYIISGPNGVGGTGSNGAATTLANGHVTVPSSTWKVALVLPKDSGDDLSHVTCSTRTIAVIMPNTQTINIDWHTYLTTVDAVETLTGYDLFSNLPEPYQRCIEAGTNGTNPPLVKGDQTIAFPQPPDSSYGDAPFTVSATGGASGNPVTFTASGACTSTGSYGATITILAPGSCTITVSQAGSDIYNAAADVVRAVTVHRATPVFTALSSPTIEAGTASVAIGGTLTLGALVPTGDVAVTLNGVTLNAPIAANGQFSATFVTGSLSVANSPYVISFAYFGDPNFNAATGSSSLAVVDTGVPAIGALTATPGLLSPPNHKLVDILVSYTATDASGPPACALTVSSNEPVNVTDDGNTNSDWTIFSLDPHHVQLRAERAGTGTGRIYTITATCSDAYGHSTSNSTTVTVPK